MQGLHALKEEPLIIKDDRVCQWDGKKPHQFGLVSGIGMSEGFRVKYATWELRPMAIVF